MASATNRRLAAVHVGSIPPAGVPRRQDLDRSGASFFCSLAELQDAEDKGKLHDLVFMSDHNTSGLQQQRPAGRNVGCGCRASGHGVRRAASSASIFSEEVAGHDGA